MTGKAILSRKGLSLSTKKASFESTSATCEIIETLEGKWKQTQSCIAWGNDHS